MADKDDTLAADGMKAARAGEWRARCLRRYRTRRERSAYIDVHAAEEGRLVGIPERQVN